MIARSFGNFLASDLDAICLVLVRVILDFLMAAFFAALALLVAVPNDCCPNVPVAANPWTHLHLV